MDNKKVINHDHHFEGGEPKKKKKRLRHLHIPKSLGKKVQIEREGPDKRSGKAWQHHKLTDSGASALALAGFSRKRELAACGAFGIALGRVNPCAPQLFFPAEKGKKKKKRE